jgi:hypothetical protein
MTRSSELLKRVALAAILSMGGCSKGKELAGATSETTSGEAIKAAVTFSDGTVAARVKVLIVEDSLWLSNVIDGKSPVLDSAVTDDKGRFTLALPKGRRCNLQIDRGGEGFFLRGAAVLADTAAGAPVRSIKLAPAAAFSGTVTADSGSAESLRLSGSTYSSTVGTDGGYAFAGVAEGTFPVVADVHHGESRLPAMARAIVLEAGDNLTGRDFQVGLNRILIDDFDQGFDRTALGGLVGGGKWYRTTDAPAGGNSSSEAAEISDSGAFAGISVQARLGLGADLGRPYAMIGFFFGQAAQGRVYDLTDAHTLSFWAKGSGIINVRFTSQAVRRLYLDSAHFTHIQPLTPAWTRYDIMLDSLKPTPNAPAALKAWTWKEAAKEMTAIDFKASYPSSTSGDTILLNLDDVRLLGVSLGTFAP